MKINVIFTILFIFISKISIAHPSKKDSSNWFKFNTETCENIGTFDKKLYAKDEIAAAYFLWFEYSEIFFEAIENPTDIKKINFLKFENEYINKLKFLENLKIIKNKFWEKVKKDRIKSFSEVYNFNKIKLLSYTDPKILLNNKYSKTCHEYVSILNSQDQTVILDEWIRLINEQKKKNASPDNIEKIFLKQLNSPDKLLFAKIALTEYAWHNCSNKLIFRINYEEKMRVEFLKFFKKIKSKCDEP